MFYRKYLKYCNKKKNLEKKMYGGDPTTDIKVMDHGDADIIRTNNRNGLCNNIESLDVSKIFSVRFENIKFLPGKKSATENNPPQIPYFEHIHVNHRIYTAKSMVGHGSSGIVLVYKNKDMVGRDVGFTVKFGNVESDISILQYIKTRNICGTAYVNSHYVKYNSENGYCIIMDYMDGTLGKYLNNNNLDYSTIIKIFTKIVSQLYCLSKYNLYYTDIKSANILYKCNKGANPNDSCTIDILLGDIGSIVNMNYADTADIIATATFPPLDRCDEGGCGRFHNANEKDVVWGCGILLLDMLRCDIKFYSFVEIVRFDYEALIAQVSKSIDEAKTKLHNMIHAENMRTNNNTNVAMQRSEEVGAVVAAAADAVSIPINQNINRQYIIDEILVGMLNVIQEERISLYEVYTKMKLIL